METGKEYKIWLFNRGEARACTCNVVRGIQILCMLVHEVATDTTFSYKVHSHQKHVFCIVFHGGKAPSLSDNWGIGNVQNDIVMHAPKGQAFSSAANFKNQSI